MHTHTIFMLGAYCLLCRYRHICTRLPHSSVNFAKTGDPKLVVKWDKQRTSIHHLLRWRCLPKWTWSWTKLAFILVLDNALNSTHSFLYQIWLWECRGNFWVSQWESHVAQEVSGFPYPKDLKRANKAHLPVIVNVDKLTHCGKKSATILAAVCGVA